MRPETITKRETTFAGNLTSNKGIQFKLKNTIDIGDGFSIKSIRPSYSDYYYNTTTEKKSICLHFTVGYILSDIDALATSGNHVSVSYLVDRSGNIYELFPDNCWSYHLGTGTVGGNGTMSKQSIGIEISNYGPLAESGDNIIDVYKNVYCTKAETEYYEKFPYRGNTYYATMSSVQINAVEHLLRYLTSKHNIPMDFRSSDEPFSTATDAVGFQGIFYHSNVRKDKFDWPFYPSLQKLIAQCTTQKTTTPQVDTVEPDIIKDEPDVEQKETVASEAAVTPSESKPAETKQSIQEEKTQSIIEMILNFFLQLLGK